MTAHEAPRFIALTRVNADRQADFESFVRDVIDPAVDRVRPQLGPLWQALRPTTATDGVAVYGLLFHGDASLDDWDLETLFTEAYGAEEGSRRHQEFEGLMVGEQQVYEFSGDMRGA